LELIEEWVGQGRYMQVTAQSLLGLFGHKAQDFATTLLDKGLVHFIASDAHDLKGRPPRLDLAHGWLRERYSAELADLLCIEHPRAVVRNEELDLEAFPPKAKVAKRSLLARWFARGG